MVRLCFGKGIHDGFGGTNLPKPQQKTRNQVQITGTYSKTLDKQLLRLYYMHKLGNKERHMTFVELMAAGFVINLISVAVTGQPFSICVSGC